MLVPPEPYISTLKLNQERRSSGSFFGNKKCKAQTYLVYFHRFQLQRMRVQDMNMASHISFVCEDSPMKYT